MSADEQIRNVLAEYAKLPNGIADLGPNDDLFQKGMTSHASVNVMLALEEEFDIEFPDRMLRKSTFESLSAIEAAILELTAAAKV